MFCLPVTLLAGALVRWAAPVVAAHLPGRLTAYGILGCRRPRLFITAISAMLGAVSHLVWDRLAVGAFDLTSSIIGAAVTLFLLIRYPPEPSQQAADGAGQGRSEQPAPAVDPVPQGQPAPFWPVAISVTGVIVAVSLRLPGAFLMHTTGARVLIALAAGMLAGTACVRALRVQPSTAG